MRQLCEAGAELDEALVIIMIIIIVVIIMIIMIIIVVIILIMIIMIIVTITIIVVIVIVILAIDNDNDSNDDNDNNDKSNNNNNSSTNHNSNINDSSNDTSNATRPRETAPRPCWPPPWRATPRPCGSNASISIRLMMCYYSCTRFILTYQLFINVSITIIVTAYYEVVRLLCDARAAPGKAGRDGLAPLHAASHVGHYIMNKYN